jgi:hypothetical protein
MAVNTVTTAMQVVNAKATAKIAAIFFMIASPGFADIWRCIGKLAWLLSSLPLSVRLLDLYLCTGVGGFQGAGLGCAERSSPSLRRRTLAAQSCRPLRHPIVHHRFAGREGTARACPRETIRGAGRGDSRPGRCDGEAPRPICECARGPLPMVRLRATTKRRVKTSPNEWTHADY